MNVTLEQAITIYARATVKWFGANARKRTGERIQQLTKAGDLEGAKIYERVNYSTSQMENKPAYRA
jgi:hypothetical protein